MLSNIDQRYMLCEKKSVNDMVQTKKRHKKKQLRNIMNKYKNNLKSLLENIGQIHTVLNVF